MKAVTQKPTPDELEKRVERRVAAAVARGARVVGYIMDADRRPRDVVLSDDPPGASYGTCPSDDREAV